MVIIMVLIPLFVSLEQGIIEAIDTHNEIGGQKIIHNTIQIIRDVR